MPKRAEKQAEYKLSEAPRAWTSSRECEQESAKFLHAAQRYIGRGQIESEWCESQQLLMKLAYFIDSAAFTPDWVKTLQNMLRIAERSLTNGELRCRAVQAVHVAGATWKTPEGQASLAARRRCVTGLVSQLQALDQAFTLLHHDLDEVATKLDAYHKDLAHPGAKTAERIVAEIIVEGADALGFIVEPKESPQAEISRLQRQFERDVAVHGSRSSTPSIARTASAPLARTRRSLKFA
jgi:hypothetical protein